MKNEEINIPVRRQNDRYDSIKKRSSQGHKHKQKRKGSLKYYVAVGAITFLLGLHLGRTLPTGPDKETKAPVERQFTEDEVRSQELYEQEIEREYLEKSQEEGKAYKAQEEAEAQEFLNGIEQFNQEQDELKRQEFENHADDIRNGRGL